MRFACNQYNYYDSAYRIPSKHHNASHLHHKNNFGMRMTMATASTMTPRVHRKGFRIPSKRHPGKALPGKLHSMSRVGPGKIPPGKRMQQRPQPPPCDNSNDSGFGFDQHVEVQNSNQHMIRSMPVSRSTRNDAEQHDEIGTDDSDETYSIIPNHHHHHHSIQNRVQYRAKRKKIERVVELENDDACSEDAFISRIASATTTIPNNTSINNNNNNHNAYVTPLPQPTTKYSSNGARSAPRVAHKRQPPASLNNVATSSNGRVQLEILSQPEQQHRARYQTEGSRGAVKDRSGNGFPIVRMVGYNKPALLQVFIGTDIGRVAPHMFYQACKVAGKNSTQCNEKKVDGTMIIEIDFKPELDMTITCDCVGILKERNVDVEHRFPDHLAQKSKKKSTRCRMVFRTQLTHDDGTVETLQVCSNPIICTQPPGVPEICKKSLNSCPVDGGLELFIIGKNFLKDTHVLFQETLDDIRTNDMVTINSLWEQSVLPDKEYLQQTHLICTVPPYIHQNILKPVTVQLFIISSGKKSESHTFTYTPKGTYTTLSAATTLSTLHGSMSGQDTRYMDTNGGVPNAAGNAAVVQQMWTETKHEIDADMMPPPASTQIPMIVRRPSLTSAMITDQMVIGGLKTEILDENSQNSIADAMQSAESLERFPVVQGDSGLLVDQNPLMMHNQRLRKQSIDMLDMQSMSLLNESNSLPSFPTHHSDMNAMAAAAAVDIAVKNEQIAKEILTAAVVHQGQQTVDKFLSSLSPTISDLKPSPQMEQNSIFNVNNTGAGAGVIFPQQAANNMVMASNAVNNIDQTLNDMLAVASHSPSTDMQSLSLVRSSSVSSTSSSSSSSSSSSPNSSPMTHDIILNSEPAAVITSVNMQQMLSGTEPSAVVQQQQQQQPTDHIPAEMILNSNISPSTILCPPNSVPNLMVNQVSLLNGIGMQPQSSQDSLLNSIIMTPPSNSPPIQQQTSPQPQQQQQSPPRQVVPVVDQQTDPQVTATSTAVSNMIIKAAADFISNHENNPESAIDALMSLNDSPIQTQSQVSQILGGSPVTTNTMVPNAQPGLCSSAQFLANTRHHQMLEARQQETVPLVNMLLNHDVQNVTATDAAQTQYLQSLQKSNQLTMSVSPQTNQESLIQAVALAGNALQKNNVAVAQKQLSGMLPNVSLTVPQTTGPIPAAATAIPQELTIMSDQDLISYINPSTFDQI
ncbi:nuclear factor of activated T-cells 5-like isoform X2 [Eupeodes corollae]|uniref:nuclear factor of activated T-cells 5-like isoform X2 n=1 Tax=Eupeodes corollae TaxID=290404 RepID=UPI0024918BB7|nr:nuclear factor of activated T-cells 5-like isoform X2 [Eupeodes corollae]